MVENLENQAPAGSTDIPVFNTAEEVGAAIKANPNIFSDKKDVTPDFSEYAYAKEFGIIEDFDDNFKALKTPEERKAFLKTKFDEKVKANSSTDDEDDFIKEYKEKKKDPAFNKNSFLAEKAKDLLRFEGKTSDDIIKEVYLENKYTEEQIDEFLKTKSAIEKDHLANSIKDQHEKKKTQISEDEYKILVDKTTAEITKNNSSLENAIKLFVEKELKGNKYPIKFAESEILEIQKDSFDFLKTEIVKGADGRFITKSKFNEFMENDEKMQLAIPLLTMIDKGTFPDFMKKLTTQVKDGEWDKINSPDSVIQDQKNKGGFSYADYQ